MPYFVPLVISVNLFIIILLALGVMVGLRLYRNIKNEKHKEQGKVIQRIMKTYAVVQCIMWPFIIICMGLLRINKVLINFLPPSFERHAISMLRSLFGLLRNYVGFNSLIIAICRYCFIVFDQTTSAFGIHRARKALVCGSFAIPMLMTVLSAATVPMAHGWIALWTAEDAFQSPIYELVHSLLPKSVTYGIALFAMSLRAIIFSNIGEGFIYLHIYIYGRR